MLTTQRTIGHLKLHVREDENEIRDFFARDISKKLREYLNGAHRDVLFLSAGGSALSMLDYMSKDVFGPHLTIGIFDERFDPARLALNFNALRKTQFFQHAVSGGCRLIDTMAKKEHSKEQLAEYFEEELREWRRRHPGGAIVATLGIALDGHTAGIVPLPENPKRFQQLFESPRWVIAYDGTGNDGPSTRVTPTFTFLRAVDYVGVFLVGAEKGEMFRKLLSGQECAEIPGRIVTTLSHGAVYTDLALARHAGLTS